MCLAMSTKKQDPSQLILAAGYESGHVCVYSISSSTWSSLYSCKSHSQPVLSIAIHPSQDFVFTTSADALIAQHPIAIAAQPLNTRNTKHSGQSSLRVRSDGRIFVTAGWDGVGRIYSSTTLKQVAVLKWHLGGIQAAVFAQDKKWIVLGGKDAKISLWEIYT
jgi:ASTRA-associated protein 1